MISFPNAKINIGLVNHGLREDGFHEIRSTMYSIPIYDSLEIVIGNTGNDKCSLTISGIEVSADDNLCKHAYQLLDSEFDLGPVRMHLHKVIPIGAGLGGGSSDASKTILMLNEMFQLKMTVEDMKIRAAKLGSDCPFFITNEPVIATGRGDLLERTELKLGGYFLALVYPNFHIDTGDAYKHIQGSKDKVAIDPDSKKIRDWREYIFNDFENYVFGTFPEISQIKSDLYERGAVYASLSGSGSSVYGIFPSSVDLTSQFGKYQVWKLTL
ncbi:MAG: 4-(cytidine 5'-diphospho)-2-C-methyl-D-erythritol kinase [Bacteroidetes bacterium]|nr:MAG: 4-(cytidine 5'-diphospho)-2-C-methyl-D-erythritol kinase [Bacteroidota bacterium]